MSTVSPSQIKTLSQAYKEGKLSAKHSSSFKPSDEINNKVSLWQGDITRLAVDAVQNAANSGLRGGGGIDGAIHRAAGNELYDACAKLNGCKTGNTKITPGFNLPAKHILHTVGPVYSASRKAECESQLGGCYETTLQLAVDDKLKSVALCGVSTGIYGFPLGPATEIALRTVRTFLDDHASELGRVIFCNFGAKDVQQYEELVSKYFPPAE
ncbi:macro domain-like protein [Cystobasidium minutum MCA 4210]|uniref:macro domain-like protein n=1 Tax=Cystobasidium minutum MCA 4210 TaxID=1397322 RepID=UPI0034CE2D24|eukprot:jgi/Rhomi1/198167/gm1.6381_g